MKEFKTLKLLRKTYDNLLAEIAKTNNLTLNELKILVFLKDNDKNNAAKDIVEGLGSTKSHISMSVSNLEEKGYIIRKRDEYDKKTSHLNITDKSLEIIEKSKNVQNEVKKIMSKGITKEEIDTLNKIWQKIGQNLEEYNRK